MSIVRFLLSFIFSLTLSLGAFANNAENYICSANSQKIKEAKKFIHEFQKLSHEYDNNLINMYSDKAKIFRTLIYPNGKTEKVVIPIKNYKNALKILRVWAKFKGYKNYYKNLSYKMEGQNVRIIGLRETSNGYKTPFTLLVGKGKILEEETNTKSIFLVKKVLSK